MLQNNIKKSSLPRILDANLNRLKEGIRVIEDICRYLYNYEDIVYEFKNMRHQARLELFEDILQTRDVPNDVAKNSIDTEIFRQDLYSLLHANFCRICESARVLEECLKLQECHKYGNSETFKQIRYNVYHLHATLVQRIKSQ